MTNTFITAAAYPHTRNHPTLGPVREIGYGHGCRVLEGKFAGWRVKVVANRGERLYSAKGAVRRVPAA